MSFVNYIFDTPDDALDATKLYEGTVVNNNDPKQIGRVRVRVEQLMPSEAIPEEHCPWAIMRRPMGWGSKADRSMFAVPEVGSQVFVQFLGGCIYSPVYETLPTDGKTKQTNLAKNYPKRYGFKDPDESELVVDYQDHTVDIVHQSDYQFHIKQDKSVHINVANDETEVVSRDVTINIGRDCSITISRDKTQQVTGKYTLNVVGNVLIKGEKITLAPNIPGTNQVRLGSETPVDFIALKAAIDKIKTAFDSHNHSGVQGGAGTTGAPTSPIPPYTPLVDYTQETKAS